MSSRAFNQRQRLFLGAPIRFWSYMFCGENFLFFYDCRIGSFQDLRFWAGVYLSNNEIILARRERIFALSLLYAHGLSPLSRRAITAGQARRCLSRLCPWPDCWDARRDSDDGRRARS
jgi:hypothetical protein